MRIPDFGSAAGGYRYMPVRAQTGAYEGLMGVGDALHNAAKSLGAIQDLIEEEEAARKKGLILDARNKYDIFNAERFADYQDRFDTGDWRNDYMSKSEEYISKLLADIPVDMQEEAEQMLRGQQTDGLVRVIGQSASKANEFENRSWKANLERLEEQGDYEGQKRLVMARDDFLPAEKAAALAGISRRQKQDTYLGMMDTNPGGFYDAWESGELDSVFSRSQQAIMIRELRRRNEEAWNGGLVEALEMPKSSSIGGGVSSGGGGVSKQAWRPEETGIYGKEYFTWYDLMNKGDTAQATRFAYNFLYNMAMARDPNATPASRMYFDDEFKKQAKYMRLSTETANAILAESDQKLTDLASPTISVSSILNNLQTQGKLVDNAMLAELNKTYMHDNKEKNYGVRSGDDEEDFNMRDEWGEAAGVLPEDDRQQAFAKIKSHRMDIANTQLNQKILTRFNSWRNTPEGKKASEAIQAEMLRKFIKIESGANVPEVVALARASASGEDSMAAAMSRYEDLRQRTNQWEDYVRGRTGKGTGEMLVQADEALKEKQVSDVKKARARAVGLPDYSNMRKGEIGFDTKQKDLERGVLVPEGMGEVGDVVWIQFPNGNYLKLPVVGKASGQLPQLTYRVARDNYYDPKASWMCDYKILRSGKKQEANQ